ncbi:riboflavin synthase [Sphingomonas baiyangensis]|uniref:Riboflavin synthase n=1 Tax=Sphingomonas baiyangensis TaxID=2572576 RepID=A0A4V6WRG4_9SPHN|nr:riboflavin synthase [Sphingomonas baiyangensis]TKD51828.1 riboflavin synthase [Sphingomonas baiyangensis]
MFTGIVTDIGTIDAIEDRGDLRVHVATAYDTARIDLGASVACSGVCLTVVDKTAGRLAFDVSAESVSRTAQGMWAEGRRLNLERALRLGDELGGHIVTGHVDGVGHVTDVTPDGDSKRIGFAVDAGIAPFVAPKGSITIDGVSLTVNTVEDRPDGTTRFAINLIPHTQAVTTLGALAAGDAVNLEIDVLARYLQRMEQLRAKA